MSDLEIDTGETTDRSSRLQQIHEFWTQPVETDPTNRQNNYPT